MPAPTTLGVLVAANILLQLFDAIATYAGWERYGEMNPILRWGFELWGAGPTLLIAKIPAVFLVIVLARTPHRTLAAAALAFTSIAYVVLSFVPWTSLFLS